MTFAVLVATTAYLLGVRRYGTGGRAWSRGRTAAFLCGAVLLLGALSPPVEALAHHDPRGHVAQHLLIGMYAPLGLVLGRPLTLLLATLPVRSARRVTALLRTAPAHLLAHPLAAAVLSTASLFGLYLTPLYAVAAGSGPLHHVLHLHFLLAGYLFTWAVAGPDPVPQRPGLPMRVAALTVAAAAHAYLAKQLYAGAADLLPAGHHGTAAAQQAAQWMYYGGDVAEVLLATAMFAWWYRRRAPLAPAV
jgi:putative membrane protein